MPLLLLVLLLEFLEGCPLQKALHLTHVVQPRARRLAAAAAAAAAAQSS